MMRGSWLEVLKFRMIQERFPKTSPFTRCCTRILPQSRVSEPTALRLEITSYTHKLYIINPI